jgi:Fungal specific transcription factor domain/Fungal Zn(2)-Cys(6) binuclear cluster domain
MSKTESIDSLLSPSLRVSRPVAACSRCRAAKIKCDGKLPSCSACERSGKSDSCSSANDDFARGKERSYTAALELAAQRLQKKIDVLKAAANDSREPHNDNAPGRARPRGKRQISGSQRREAFDVNELVSDFGFLTVNATSRDFHGFTSEMSFAKLLMSIAVKKNFSSVVPSKLPPRYAIIQSLERYLSRVFVLLPIFSETDFMSSVSRVYHNASSTVPVTPQDFWNIRLVLAISEASMCQVQGDHHDQAALQHMAAAMELADYVIHPGAMAGVQALLLLVEYALLDPAHFDCWYLVGMASRLVVDLGLHCELSVETKIERADLNMRRQVFHSTYALDRLISMALGYAFSFTDDSASGVPLPDLGQGVDSHPASNVFLHSIKACLYLFDIRRVQSAFYQTTRWSSRALWSEAQANSYAGSVSSDIRAWYSSIPVSLPANQLTLFNLERLYTQLLIVCPSQKTPMVEMTDVNKALVFEYCVQFIEELHPITVNADYQPFTSCADIWRTKWVGRQFLEVMWSDFDRLLKTQHVTVGNIAPGHSAQGTCIVPSIACDRLLSCWIMAVGAGAYVKRRTSSRRSRQCLLGDSRFDSRSLQQLL